jgi:hypothetical protein
MNDATVIAALGAHLRTKTPPTGQSVRVVYDYPPDSLGATPAIVLFPGTDSVNYGAANRTTVLNIDAVLYLPAVEYSRQYALLSAWRTWMRDSLLDGVLLDGAEGVSQASIVSTVIDSTEYGDAPFITVTGNIAVAGVEAISPSA